MGIFSGLAQLKGGDRTSAMTPTDRNMITPANPGSMRSLRSIPVIDSMRPIDPIEAERLTALAEQREELAQSTEKGYAAIESIEKSDRKIHEKYRGYQLVVATEELGKKEADSTYLTGLNRLKPGYAKCAANLLESHKQSNRKIEAIEARTRQILKGVY